MTNTNTTSEGMTMQAADFHKGDSLTYHRTSRYTYQGKPVAPCGGWVMHLTVVQVFAKRNRLKVRDQYGSQYVLVLDRIEGTLVKVEAGVLQ